MNTVILITVLVLAPRAPADTTQSPESTDISDLTSSPLLTSDCMRVQLDRHASDDHMISTMKLLENLKWNDTIVFYDQDHWGNDHQLLPVPGLAATYDFSDLHSSVEVKQLLKQLHKKFYPNLNFLLLSNYSRALQLLQIVDSFDLESNRTTEFRHHSFWVVSCYSPRQHITGLLPHIFHLENLVLIVSDKTGGCYFRQLLTTPGGRSLSEELSIGRLNKDIFPNTKYGLNNRTLIVSTLAYDPFIMKKGNTFEGYYIDILDAIASTLNFSYEIIHPADMSWGAIVDNKWDGLIGQLERREIDLTVAPLAIHQDREMVMDFLYPPIYSWIDDIMYKLQPEETKSWPFYLKPFGSFVFLLLSIALVVTTLIGYILFRWDGADNGKERKQDTWFCILADTFFYMFGILFIRGLESNREYSSTRLLLFTWGVFSVIVSACYSANLVASFADQKPQLPFTSLGELVRQKEYKWGFKSGSILEHIFNISTSDDMKMAWEGILKFNKTDPEVLSREFSVHIAKVKAEKYATILFRYTIEKLARNDCSIRSVGQDISWRYSSIGVPTDYPLRRNLEDILAVITDSGLLDIWWRRWSKLNVDLCMEDRRVSTLSLTDVASIFYILCGGLGVSGVVLVLELMKGKLSKST